MIVRDIMTRGAQVVHPDSTVQQAAQMMKDLDIGPLPVCDGRRIVGMVTDRDITIRSTATGKDPTRQPVREVMTNEVLYCRDGEDVAVATRIMQDNQVRRLMVIDDDNRLVGIVSLGDVANETDEDVAGETLEAVSQPGGTNR
jgi:CBS domain-containing protein